jgi:hypothetical protein
VSLPAAQPFTATSASPRAVLATLLVPPPPSLDAITHGTEVDVQWEASPAAASRPLEYAVLRRAAGGAFAQIARTAELRFTDAPGSGSFDYVVRAVISTFTSADSPVASATVIP